MDDEQSILTEDDTLYNQVEDNFDPNLVIDDAPNPYEIIEKKDNLKHLMFIFNTQLTEEQKRIVDLKFGFSAKPKTIRMIAKILNLKCINVVHSLQDAMATLQKNWGLPKDEMAPEHGRWYYTAQAYRLNNQLRKKREKEARDRFAVLVNNSSDYDLVRLLLNFGFGWKVSEIIVSHAKREIENFEMLKRLYGDVISGEVEIDKKVVETFNNHYHEELDICEEYIETKYGRFWSTSMNIEFRELLLSLNKNLKMLKYSIEMLDNNGGSK